MTTTGSGAQSSVIGDEARALDNIPEFEAPPVQSTVSLTELFQQKLKLLNAHEEAAKALRFEMQALRDSMTGVAWKRPNKKAEKAAAKHGRGARKKPRSTAQDQRLPGTDPAPIT